MLNRIIDFSLRHRFAVILAALVVAAGGVASVARLDIDAFPDTTPVQVQVNTVAPALGPEEIEQRITAPVEQALTGLARLQSVRSISKFGLSQVTVLFEDGTDIYFARQLINERLATVELPQGVERPKMGPISTGLGEVFHYVVGGKTDDVTELRTVHDWVVRPQLRQVPGVAEVNSWGGFAKQYQVRIDPDELFHYHLTFDEVARAIEENNRNAGGGTTRREGEVVLVRGVGRPASREQIGNVVIKSVDGVPIRVKQVAEIEVGHEVRRGAVTADGKGEVVLGLGFTTMGENTHDVTLGLKNKLDDIKAGLSANVKLEPVYERTELIDHVIDTVRKNLFEAGLLVVAVLFAFLGNIRAALIVAAAIPLSMLLAFSGMLRFSIAASLLSLGAIDFGMIVDSSVVMVENCVRHLAHDRGRRPRLEVIREAAVEVRKPTLYGELIIMIVYLPILTLEGADGKLYRPMALTVIFALTGSVILSLTLMPVLASLLLPRRVQEREPVLIRLAKVLYLPVLRWSLGHKAAVLGLAACLLLFAYGLLVPNLGAERRPRLSEGAIAINVVRLASTDLEDTVYANTQMERAILKAFPDEVAHVWSRIGTAEVATDPMGFDLTDMYITLRPRDRWKRAATQPELEVLIEKELRQIPGQKLAFAQPIELRMNEIETGVRSEVAVLVFGDDLRVMEDKAKEVQRVLASIPGAANAKVESANLQPVLQVRIDQDEIARSDVSVKAVLDLVEAVGTKPLGEIYEGQYRFPLTLRLAEHHRFDPQAIGSLLMPTPAGYLIPLARLAKLDIVEGPATISREWGQRRIAVTCEVRDRDLASFVEEGRRRVAAEVTLPNSRYRIEWGGDYGEMVRGLIRLLVVGILALLLIFGLLYLSYQSVADALRVFLGVPFACVGGIMALWLRDMPFSIPAAVGFIALSGLAVLDDMILVSTIRQLRARGRPLEQAVEEAAVIRLRPVLMTTLVASLGFVPMALSTGMGAEVQRPLATVVIGGVLSAMVMSLVVLRVLYVLFQFRGKQEIPVCQASGGCEPPV